MIRIVVAIDINTDCPRDAYRRLYAILPEQCAWESTDEWYAANGERVPQREIDAITTHYAVFADRE